MHRAAISKDEARPLSISRMDIMERTQRIGSHSPAWWSAGG
jgi:hypothetical protein